DRTNVRRLFGDLQAEAERPDAAWYSPEDKKRLAHFSAHLDEWLEKAHRAAILRAEERAQREVVAVTGPGHAPFAGLRNLIDADRLRPDPAARSGTSAVAAPAVVAPAAAAAAPAPRRPPL